jgi:hypothetical protein
MAMPAMQMNGVHRRVTARMSKSTPTDEFLALHQDALPFHASRWEVEPVLTLWATEPARRWNGCDSSQRTSCGFLGQLRVPVLRPWPHGKGHARKS